MINVSFFYTAFPGIPGRCVFGLGRELFSCCRFCLILADYVADEDADKNNCSDVARNAVDNIDEITESEQTVPIMPRTVRAMIAILYFADFSLVVILRQKPHIIGQAVV